MKINKNHIVIGGLAVGALLLYSVGTRRIVSAAVGVAADTAVGVVYGVSDVIGLENPDKSLCQQAKDNDSLWDASFACEADDFIKYWWQK